MESQCKSRDIRLWNVEEMQTSRPKGLRDCFAESLAGQAGRSISKVEVDCLSFDVTPSFQVRLPGVLRAAGRYSRTIEWGESARYCERVVRTRDALAVWDNGWRGMHCKNLSEEDGKSKELATDSVDDTPLQMLVLA